MKININTLGLDKQLEKLKANKSLWKGNDISFENIDLSEIKSIKGKEVTLDDLSTNDHGLIIYKGRPQMLYIRDVQVARQLIEHMPESNKVRRFHVAKKCEVLKNMEERGRYDRYRITENKSGYFEVDAYESINSKKLVPVEAKLKVCKACLLELNYFGIYSYLDLKKEDWLNFDIVQFFDKYKVNFKKPKFNKFNEPGSSYSKNWDKISSNYKASMNWTCERCDLDLNSHKHLLHCHHKNGVKGDVTSSNLESICFDCHNKEHGKIISKSNHYENIEILKNLKIKQGV